MAGSSTQMRELGVPPGLYVLRYLGGTDVRSSPTAIVRVATDCSGDVDIISPPGASPGEMAGPGANIVLVSRRDARVVVTIRAVQGSSNLDARFSLELLAAAQSEAELAQGARVTERTVVESTPSPRVELLAHVTRRGDVGVGPDGWIGGPRMPTAIEGIEIRTGTTEVGIAVQYTNMLEQGRWSDWVSPGSFAGTRQRATPLTGLRVKAVGSRAADFEISIEAMFLGAPVATHRGREIEIASAGSADPLVGLKIELLPSQSARNDNAERRGPRVRVFR